MRQFWLVCLTSFWTHLCNSSRFLMATCMHKIGIWESCLQLHTAMSLAIRVTDPTVCPGGTFSWMRRPSFSSWGVAHHLINIVLHWEQCCHLLWCGAPHQSCHCKRHKEVNVPVQKRCIWLLIQDLRSSSDLTADVKMQIQCSIQWKPKDWHI